jgi:hypothetical protein
VAGVLLQLAEQSLVHSLQLVQQHLLLLQALLVEHQQLFG